MVRFHATLALVIVGGTALVTLALTVLAWRAQRRTGDRRLWFVVAAFAVFCLKSVVTMLALSGPEALAVSHGHLEFMGSAFDLAIAALLFLPFLRRA